ncbi:hypothetical protein D3C86_1586480 [compost metagenome]
MEPHATVVQMIGGVCFDAAFEQVLFRRAAARDHLGRQVVVRLQQSGRFQRKAQAIRLQQAVGRGQHRREHPTVARLLLGPAFVGDAPEHAVQLHRCQAVALLEERFRKLVGKEPPQPVVGDAEVDIRHHVGLFEAQLACQRPRLVLDRLHQEVAAVRLSHEHALFGKKRKGFVDRRARHPEAVGQELRGQMGARRHGVGLDQIEDLRGNGLIGPHGAGFSRESGGLRWPCLRRCHASPSSCAGSTG